MSSFSAKAMALTVSDGGTAACNDMLSMVLVFCYLAGSLNLFVFNGEFSGIIFSFIIKKRLHD